jgi:nucleotide-binding universal stress UspA family protein
VDFSHHADQAVDYAVEMARALGAEVHVLHVFRRPVEIFSPYELALPPSVTEDLQAAVRRQLDVAHQKVKDAGLSGEAMVREGDPATIIADEAGGISADLIIMGTRGLSGLKHALMGSVAERVVRTAPCPVLTVRSEEDED